MDSHSPLKSRVPAVSAETPSKPAKRRGKTRSSSSGKSSSGKSSSVKPASVKSASGKAKPVAKTVAAKSTAAQSSTAKPRKTRAATSTATNAKKTTKQKADTGVKTLPPAAKVTELAASSALRLASAGTPPALATQTRNSGGQSPEQGFPLPDFEALARNMPRIMAETSKALTAAFKPSEEGHTNPDLMEHAADAIKTLGTVAEYWLADPDRAMAAQQSLTGPLIALWGNTWQRLQGENPAPVDEPDASDKRFSDPMWRENPIYDFLRQAYAITSDWANHMAAEASGIDPFSREKALFYIRQITGAISPSNFIPTNPELLRKTLEENGENLVRGLAMLAEDIEAGKGQLKIRQSDNTKFELGRDMAMSPGKVIFRNDLMELIQYAPATGTVYKRPLLIVPPWINKFYVLDLNPEKSFVKFCVESGLTVFLVSWVNPDQKQAQKSFEDYMREGILTALDAIEQATGERDVSAIGYCVGGTLLSITLAYMAAVGDRRISSATLFTTQVDFTDAGDLKLFVDATRIKALEERMRQTGYLEGAKMSAAFNMLRPNELIWSFFVNNYLKGKEPMPFDLLAWNSDSTRMPAANHSFYLRNCYLENTLTRGEMVIDGEKLDLKKVTIPIYNLAAREDHIAPPRSVFNGAKFFGGDMRYVLAGSGHIAGVVNPVSKPKYQFWTGPAPSGKYEEWVASAKETPGTWWTDWIVWITSQATEKVPARTPGDGKMKPLCDAPGEYVRVKS